MPKNPAPVATEHEEQVALFQWAAIQGQSIPALKLLFAVPNGGQRHPAVAVKMKHEGVKPGVPDMFLPIARGGRHGLFIELKRAKGGTLSAAQLAWINALRGEGYEAICCRGWQEASSAILAYLSDGRISRGTGPRLKEGVSP